MIFLIFLLALSVNASEIDINYKWYKYTESNYMSIEDSKKLENPYIDYNDYQINEYFNIKDYEELKGRYIYIYNKSGKRVEFESINILNDGKAIDYRSLVQLGDDKPIALSTKGKVMLDLKNSYYLKNLEIEVVYSGGNIDISFSNRGQLKDTRLAYEQVTESGSYKLNHINDKKEILYKTYYNIEYGEYRKEAYDDYIYKDLNDYKIYYFFYKNVINDKNVKIEDLLNTNYTLKNIEGNIDYNTNGKYKIKLIFEECVKEIDVIVDINSKINELEIKIEELNSLNSKYKEEIDELEKIKDENNNKINKLEIKIEELNSLNIKYKKEIDKLEKIKDENNNKINKLDIKIEELNSLNIKYKEEIDKLKKENNNKINKLEIELKNNEEKIIKLKEEIIDIKKEKDDEIISLKDKMKILKEDNKNKISVLNDKLSKCKTESKEQIKSLKAEMKEKENKLKEELKNEKKEYEVTINKCETESKEQIKSLKVEMKEKENKLKEELKNEKKEYEENIKKYKIESKEQIKSLKTEMKEKENKLKEEITNITKEYEEIINKYKIELNNNKNIYEKNKNNYNKIVELKNACFEELNRVVDVANNKAKELKILKNKYNYEKDYNERYIKKLKYVIDEKDVDYWNIKKCSIFVGFKKIY